MAALVEENRRLERQAAEYKRSALTLEAGGKVGWPTTTVGGFRFIGKLVPDANAEDLRAIADRAKIQVNSGVVAFATSVGGKASLIVGVTQDLAASVSAVDLVRIGAQAVGGKGGGGRPDMAQAGGPDGAKAQDALDAIKRALQEKSAA